MGQCFVEMQSMGVTRQRLQEFGQLASSMNCGCTALDPAECAKNEIAGTGRTGVAPVQEHGIRGSLSWHGEKKGVGRGTIPRAAWKPRKHENMGKNGQKRRGIDVSVNYIFMITWKQSGLMGIAATPPGIAAGGTQVRHPAC
jgi:hypothetical protein